jgi:hypothetical protein
MQVFSIGTDAIDRCHGKKEWEQCDKADRIGHALANLCDAQDPIACNLLNRMLEVESLWRVRNVIE